MRARTLISWKAPEYVYREKSKDWFFALGVITLALIIAAYIIKNLLFGIIVLLGSFTTMIFAVRRPSIITISVTETGILVKDRLFQYESLQSFWISEHPDGPFILNLKLKKAFLSAVKIVMANVDENEVRLKLSKNLQEEAHEESLMDIISEILKL